MFYFSTNRYEATWGKSPRGRGWWIFQFGPVQFTPGAELTFGEAKKAAAQHAREIEFAGAIIVCP